jgi:hypothetical protein
VGPFRTRGPAVTGSPPRSRRAPSPRAVEQLLLGRRAKALNLLAGDRLGDQLTHKPGARHAALSRRRLKLRRHAIRETDRHPSHGSHPQTAANSRLEFLTSRATRRYSCLPHCIDDPPIRVATAECGPSRPLDRPVSEEEDRAKWTLAGCPCSLPR